MEFFKTPNVNFMKYRFVALALTGAVILAGALNIFFGKGLKLGVDFGGGTLVRIVFNDPITISDIRSELGRAGLGESVIQASGSSGREFMIRTLQVISAKDALQELEAHEKLGDRVIEALRGKDGQRKFVVASKETVGPQAGADLRKKATLAVIFSLIGMLVYIGFRFKLEYGVSAIVTLTQDVLMALSVYSFTNREINLPIIAALLTIVGYSINDTVVVFDRVRENLKAMRKEPFETILNRSINQSLGRTIITTGTVFLAVLSLFLFGGKSINDFAFIMLFGSIEGVYSTIYLSCPVVLFWRQLFKPKNAGRR
jgi:preprotein translocase SecF subunit